MDNSATKSVDNPIAHFDKDKDKQDPVHFKPGLCVDILKVDPDKISILTKIRKHCLELAYNNTPKTLRKKYNAAIAIHPMWLSQDGRLHEKAEHASTEDVKQALGQLVLVYMFPVDTPQDKIDNLIRVHKLEGHQQNFKR